MTPLFIPLKAEHFDAFDQGNKFVEYRRHGGRWREELCAIGRDVVLSKGYGKQHRLRGTIKAVHVCSARHLPSKIQLDIVGCYGTTDLDIISIGIENIRRMTA